MALATLADPIPGQDNRREELMVAFGGSESSLGSKGNISGSVDRISGDVEATYLLTTDREHKWENKVLSSMNSALKCRPAQRMF